MPVFMTHLVPFGKDLSLSKTTRIRLESAKVLGIAYLNAAVRIDTILSFRVNTNTPTKSTVQSSNYYFFPCVRHSKAREKVVVENPVLCKVREMVLFSLCQARVERGAKDVRFFIATCEV